MSDSAFRAVFQDREGRIWLGGDSLYWFDGEQFHLVPGVAAIHGIAQTKDGDLWIGGSGGLYRLHSGALAHFPVQAAAVNQILQDRQGALWVVVDEHNLTRRLYRFVGGRLEPVDADVLSIAEDRGGGLWLANQLRPGLRFVRSGKSVLYDEKQGLPRNLVTSIHQDSSGTLWFSTSFGALYRFRDGRFHAITNRVGLTNEPIAIQEDGRGNLWFSSNQGIYRVGLKELNDVADGRIASILPVSYGVAEGMKSIECNGGNPGIWKARDGRIWFVTMRGVVAVDPDAGNRLPPPVVLEEAWAGQVKLGRNGRTSVKAGSNTFDFTFAALSLSAPEKQRFKYRLEPYDKEWVDAGARRTAHYSNMPPGDYSFQVIAANSYGIWNLRGDGMRFVLQPHFYQTNWFYLLCAVTFLALVRAAWQFRMRQLRQKFRQLRDVIETIPAMAWTARPDGSNEFVNRRWEEYTGLSAPETAGSGWTAAVHPEDREPYLEKWRACLATGKPFEFEGRLRCSATGEYRWFLVRGVPLREEHGKIVRWYGLVTDIEERKRSEEERDRLRQLEADLAHMNRVGILGELAASIAHEVNQPLTGIVSNGGACLRFLAGDKPDVVEAREAVRDIVRDGKRAGEIITHIRALTKRTAPP